MQGARRGEAGEICDAVYTQIDCSQLEQRPRFETRRDQCKFIGTRYGSLIVVCGRSVEARDARATQRQGRMHVRLA